ncbi:hypothetical protein PV328_005757 [Microctonus aethiopoides]|uniref:phospholipase A1 n=1 Tax=Microctonus aethiopoides TaxID=144406 RepID=A0AA39FN45_9HYME|nr:hypothetical protein PV328_005757 [Microctonus aethiopoides]
MPYFIATLFCLIISLQDVTSNPFFNPFDHLFGRISDDVTFHLYTRRNTDRSYILDPESRSRTRDNPLNPSHHTVIFIHGFNENYRSPSGQGIKDAYLKKGQFNIILVSWGKLAAMPWYVNAVLNLPAVGAYVAELIMWLDNRGINYSANLHVIGFSLGAHVASFVSEELARNGWPKIKRITGLDPAGPAFESLTTISSRLHAENAIFVDIIHTNNRALGIETAIGHADFYVNYGKPQPGCGYLNINCAHGRAWNLYVESISNPFGFPASICGRWNFFVSQCSPAENVYMGFAADPKTRGRFYVETRFTYPFATNPISLRKNVPSNRKPIQHDSHALYSHVEKLPIKLDERSVYYT